MAGGGVVGTTFCIAYVCIMHATNRIVNTLFEKSLNLVQMKDILPMKEGENYRVLWVTAKNVS